MQSIDDSNPKSGWSWSPICTESLLLRCDSVSTGESILYLFSINNRYFVQKAQVRDPFPDLKVESAQALEFLALQREYEEGGEFILLYWKCKLNSSTLTIRNVLLCGGLGQIYHASLSSSPCESESTSRGCP